MSDVLGRSNQCTGRYTAWGPMPSYDAVGRANFFNDLADGQITEHGYDQPARLDWLEPLQSQSNQCGIYSVKMLLDHHRSFGPQRS